MTKQILRRVINNFCTFVSCYYLQFIQPLIFSTLLLSDYLIRSQIIFIPFSTRIPVTSIQIRSYRMVVEIYVLKRICVVCLLSYIRNVQSLLSDRINCERASVVRLKFSEARYKFPTIGCAGENQIKKHRTITNNASRNFLRNTVDE